MSKWTHSLCTGCYKILEPGRIPVRTMPDEDSCRVKEKCCRCGELHTSGIYYRCDPAKLMCKGAHD